VLNICSRRPLCGVNRCPGTSLHLTLRKLLSQRHAHCSSLPEPSDPTRPRLRLIQSSTLHIRCQTSHQDTLGRLDYDPLRKTGLYSKRNPLEPPFKRNYTQTIELALARKVYIHKSKIVYAQRHGYIHIDIER
jgi:hypothetical protein